MLRHVHHATYLVLQHALVGKFEQELRSYFVGYTVRPSAAGRLERGVYEAVMVTRRMLRRQMILLPKAATFFTQAVMLIAENYTLSMPYPQKKLSSIHSVALISLIFSACFRVTRCIF